VPNLQLLQLRSCERIARRRTGVALACVAAALFGLTAASICAANEPAYEDLPRAWARLANDPLPPPSEHAKPDTKPDIDANKSYAIPALEIIGFDGLVDLVNRQHNSDFRSNWSTIRHNLHSSWVVDSDPFKTNQLGHPYQGSMYHGFARSAGLNYWEAMAYTFAGSAFWEIAGERMTPSRNDQIATGIGGSFLGEVLFRLSNLVLEHENVPEPWRELGAALVSPATGFNRLAFGQRFESVFPSHDPLYYSRLQIGFSGTTQDTAGTSTTKLKRSEALVDYSIDYGLPGKPGYTYTRPFDYFSLQATASSANGFENLLTRGLLVGADYEFGANCSTVAMRSTRMSATAHRAGERSDSSTRFSVTTVSAPSIGVET